MSLSMLQTGSKLYFPDSKLVINLWVFCVFVVILTAPFVVNARVLVTEFQNTQPKYIQTATGFEGVCVDIMRHLKERLSKHAIDITFPKNFTPPKRIRANLARGSTDLHCGAARSESREKTFKFSNEPLYSISTIIISRHDEQLEIQTIDDLVNARARVSSVDGTNTHKLLSSQKGLLLGAMPKKPEDGLLMLEKGRVRYFVYHDLGLSWLIERSGKKNLFKKQPFVLRKYNHWMMYSPHLSESDRLLIEKELQQLHESGVIKKIMTPYSM